MCCSFTLLCALNIRWIVSHVHLQPYPFLLINPKLSSRSFYCQLRSVLSRLCQSLHMTIEKKVITIYRFHKLVFDRRNSSLECFNRATQNYGLWQLVPVRCRTRENYSCLWWVLQEGIMTDEQCIKVQIVRLCNCSTRHKFCRIVYNGQYCDVV